MEIEHQNLFGGTGIVRIVIPEESPIDPFRSFKLYSLDPQAQIGKHQNQRDVTLLLGIDGSGSVIVNDTMIPMRKGSSISIPQKASLSIHNGSRQKPLQFWMICTRA